MNASTHCNFAMLNDLPQAADGWLSPAEYARYLEMRSAERRATWLGGRIVAKQLIKQCLSDPIEAAEIHVETRSTADGRGQRPTVFVGNQPLDWALSIAHTSHGVLAAACTDCDVALGVDLVWRDEFRARPLAWCFTEAERRWLAAGARAERSPAQLWAMKEALYKACQQGEGFSPRQIEVVPDDCRQADFPHAYSGLRRLQAWRVCGHIAALAIVERNARELAA